MEKDGYVDELNGDVVNDHRRYRKRDKREKCTKLKEVQTRDEQDMQWLEKRRKLETTRKTWTVDGDESDDEEEFKNVQGSDMDGDEIIDPLDSYMNSIINTTNKDDNIHDDKLSAATSIDRMFPDDDEFMKIDKLSPVEHSKINYVEFRKNFYIDDQLSKEKMTVEEVDAYRTKLELEVHGKNVPNPIKTWQQSGLSTKILETIRKMKFDKPLPILAQAIPVIMSGRDCIGVVSNNTAGNTLAFVLPMLTHIMAQRKLESYGDGPIGLIITKRVREIHGHITKFGKVLGICCESVDGQINTHDELQTDLQVDILVCTPPRMIDILCTDKITNMTRVSYLVMDEADHMIHMGFEPQINRIVLNIQPKRQTVLFSSAPVPLQVQLLARKLLNDPVKIQVGGRSTLSNNKHIKQLVVVTTDDNWLFRLFERLGEWYEKGKMKCDLLFRVLQIHGYPSLSLLNRDTVSDFRTNNEHNILIATTITAQGLDVKDLQLVINYDGSHYYEDYVHCVSLGATMLNFVRL